MLDIPFWSNREGYIRGFGVDRIKKNNTILIISKTIDEVSNNKRISFVNLLNY